jgi:hypothetical protein
LWLNPIGCQINHFATKEHMDPKEITLCSLPALRSPELGCSRRSGGARGERGEAAKQGDLSWLTLPTIRRRCSS